VYLYSYRFDCTGPCIGVPFAYMRDRRLKDPLPGDPLERQALVIGALIALALLSWLFWGGPR
jgi:hypothetical protein